MANSGSISMAAGAALIGLGAVFAAFLAMRLLAGIVKSLGAKPKVPVLKPEEKPKAVQPSQKQTVAQAPAQAVPPKTATPAPSGEVAAAIGVALTLHGAGGETIAAIATALALEGIGGRTLPAQSAGGTLWVSAGRIDAHGRRLAVQSRPGR